MRSCTQDVEALKALIAEMLVAPGGDEETKARGHGPNGTQLLFM
jgi:hypothetical protein